jgi:hypothetical protein
MPVAKDLICVLDFSSKLSGIENAFAAHLMPVRANPLDYICSSRIGDLPRRSGHAN